MPLVILRLEGACVAIANEHFTFFVSVSPEITLSKVDFPLPSPL